MSLLRTPTIYGAAAGPAAGPVLTNVSAAAQPATLEAFVEGVNVNGAVDVFSLELDVNGFGAYVVNGLLVID